MNSEQAIHDLIDRYLTGEITAAERTQFERQIASDETLRREVEVARHILQGFESDGEKRLAKELAQIDEATLRRIIGAKRVMRPGRMIAIAGLAAAIALGIFGMQPQQSATQLYNAYYATPVYQPTPPQRGGATHSQAYAQAIEAYNQREFASAAKLFGGSSDDELFYQAVSLTETGQMPTAIAIFTRLAQLDESEYQEDAQWLLALAYLRAGQRAEAQRVLTQIAAKSGVYTEKANELILKSKSKRWF